jgi:ribosome-binding factor A
MSPDLAGQVYVAYWEERKASKTRTAKQRRIHPAASGRAYVCRHSELSFCYDHSIEYGAKIEELILNSKRPTEPVDE